MNRLFLTFPIFLSFSLIFSIHSDSVMYVANVSSSLFNVVLWYCSMTGFKLLCQVY